MIEILTWNIQCGLGMDGRVDLGRIADVVQAFGSPNVICLQEVCRFMPELDGSGADQVEILAAAFPGTTPIFGAAIERGGSSFGNLILSRLPVVQAFRHPLPQPADPQVRHMPRQATEVTVTSARGPLRIVTTHLEFHSERQRQAQMRRLRSLHAEIAENERTPGVTPPDGPYAAIPRPAGCVICGDFNMVAGDAVYTETVSPFADGTPDLLDAWRRFHPGTPHDPTCGIFDTAQWPQGPHCRDFFFVTPDVAARIETLAVNTETDASDHQPLRLVLAD